MPSVKAAFDLHPQRLPGRLQQTNSSIQLSTIPDNSPMTHVPSGNPGSPVFGSLSRSTSPVGYNRTSLSGGSCVDPGQLLYFPERPSTASSRSSTPTYDLSKHQAATPPSAFTQAMISKANRTVLPRLHTSELPSRSPSPKSGASGLSFSRTPLPFSSTPVHTQESFLPVGSSAAAANNRGETPLPKSPTPASKSVMPAGSSAAAAHSQGTHKAPVQTFDANGEVIELGQNIIDEGYLDWHRGSGEKIYMQHREAGHMLQCPNCAQPYCIDGLRNHVNGKFSQKCKAAQSALEDLGKLNWYYKQLPWRVKLRALAKPIIDIHHKFYNWVVCGQCGEQMKAGVYSGKVHKAKCKARTLETCYVRKDRLEAWLEAYPDYKEQYRAILQTGKEHLVRM